MVCMYNIERTNFLVAQFDGRLETGIFAILASRSDSEAQYHMYPYIATINRTVVQVEFGLADCDSNDGDDGDDEDDEDDNNEEEIDKKRGYGGLYGLYFTL